MIPLQTGVAVICAALLCACGIVPAGNGDDASRLFLESMKLNNIGLDYMQRGDSDMAELCFKKALARKPNLAMAHLNLGLLYQRIGKFGEAQWQYHLAMAADPMGEIHQAVETVPVEFDTRTVGEMAFHKMSELPQIFFAQLS